VIGDRNREKCRRHTIVHKLLLRVAGKWTEQIIGLERRVDCTQCVIRVFRSSWSNGPSRMSNGNRSGLHLSHGTTVNVDTSLDVVSFSDFYFH
jgi:hypothetical protein